MLTAEEYIAGHWDAKDVWKHLSWPKHQERLLRCAEAMEGEGWADVGCGCGHSTAIMAGFKPGPWVGVDFSQTGIGRAREYFPEMDFVFVDSPESLAGAFSSGFDGVVCSEVIEHVEDDRGLVNALWRITRRVLHVTTPSRRVSDPGHLRIYDRAALEELFRGLGRAEIEGDKDFWHVTARRD